MDTGNPISKAVFSSFQRVFRQFKSTSPATSFDETRQYVHKPLRTPDAIRVLELLPGERHKNLSCRIIETRQSIPDIEFEALSYVWGKPIFSSRLHEVESDTVLHITHNLYLALRALRYPNRSRYLWADAICINQSENAEKSHQVKNMGSIYAMASMVVVWLGDGDFYETFKHLESIKELPENSNLAAIVRMIEKEWGTESDDSSITAIFKIVETEWFTRIWVVQEFVLARDVQIWAGDHHVDYKAFENAMMRYQDRFYDLVTECYRYKRSKSKDIIDNYRLAANLVKFRKRWREQAGPNSPQMSLLDCCRMLHGRPPNCTDERDLIYALLGLATEYTKVIPDYSLSVVDVFLEFTWSVLLGGNMDILHDAVLLGKGDPHPSFLFQAGYGHSYLEVSAGEKAAGMYRAACVEVVRPASVRIRGVSVGCISKCWDIFSVKPVKAEYQRKHMENRLSGLEKANREKWTAFTGDTSADISDNPVRLTRASREISKYFSSYVRPDVYTYEDCFEDPTSALANTSDDIESTNLVEIYRSVQGYDKRLINQEFTKQEDSTEGIRHRFWRTLNSYKYITPPTMPKDFGYVPRNDINEFPYYQLFTTAKGDLGKATWDAKVHDVVVIFDGSDVPFLIRETHCGDSVCWKLVGECFLDGWMDGSYSGHEVVDDVDEYLAMADAEPNIDFSYRKKTLLSEYFVLC